MASSTVPIFLVLALVRLNHIPSLLNCLLRNVQRFIFDFCQREIRIDYGMYLKYHHPILSDSFFFAYFPQSKKKRASQFTDLHHIQNN